MLKNLKKIISLICLLSASDIYALRSCPGDLHYTWNNCSGSHDLTNGMYWKGEYQKGGPNGSGELSYDQGGFEGVITSQFGVVTGLIGMQYLLIKGTKTVAMEGNFLMDEITGVTMNHGKHYFEGANLNGFSFPDAKGEGLIYVGKMTLTNGQWGYVKADSKGTVDITEGKYQNLERHYLKEISTFRKARAVELKKMYGTGDPKNSNYQKNHSEMLGKDRAKRILYLKHGDKNKPSKYLSDIFIKKLHAKK